MTPFELILRSLHELTNAELEELRGEAAAMVRRRGSPLLGAVAERHRESAW